MQDALRHHLNAQSVVKRSNGLFIVDGKKVFVKNNGSQHAETLCRGEMESLNAIGETETVKTPKALTVFSQGGSWHLVCEYLNLGVDKEEDGRKALGEAMAKLHLHNPSLIQQSASGDFVGRERKEGERRFGFDVPTCCGVLPQNNEWCDDWRTFFIRCRLKPQIDYITETENNHALNDLWPRLERKADELLRDTDNVLPSLVHGDLWSGNWGMENGIPVVFDPSSSYSDPEFEAGIQNMFGGFGAPYTREYDKILPTRPGWANRRFLYLLYHNLNHWMRTLSFLVLVVLLYGVDGVFDCAPHETTAFIRTPRTRLAGTPVVVSTAGHDLTCAQYCRNNIEPTTGAQRVCASFNFDGRETCYFFDDAAAPAGTAQFASNPSANNFYYEKTCLPAVSAHEACTYRSFSFEKTRKTTLEGFVRKSIQVGSHEQCLSACLKESEFVCRSVNYNYDSYVCEMNTEDRRSKPTHLRRTEENMDYFDNNCLTRQNRCGSSGGNLVFVKTTNFEIHFYDHTQSVEAQESYCLQKCLDSLNTFCRSVEFSPTEKNCIVSDEDTFSRADQQGQVQAKDYYEPICVAADLSSSTCRQQAAFERFIGSSIEGEVIASAQGVTISDCISLCFQNLNCKSINYDRTASTCYIYAVGRADANIKANPATDYYEFNCESQFGGMALCTNEGIRFIVNTKEPYTGAIYAAERFSTCSQVVENAKQISITFPPPTVSTDCGTVIRDGKMEALVVVSLDGVLPHQVTTEWDRFYRVSCDVSMDKMVKEGSVVVTTIYEAGTAGTQVLEVATPPPVTAQLTFVNQLEEPLEKASIGDPLLLVVTSEQAGPHNMMVTECVATRIGGFGDSAPFTLIENGCPRYPALVGPVEQDFEKNRLKSDVRAFRLDGSYDVQIMCTIMFCAGPNGCPVSNCLDSGTNELFSSHGRKKRSALEEGNTEETLSAVIRVLTKGEEEEEEIEAERMANHSTSHSLLLQDLVCMSEAWFVSSVVSLSILCLLLSALIVVWGCHSLSSSPSKDLPH